MKSNLKTEGDLVLDPCAGSGATLIACARAARVARLIELDPRYCDVSCERFRPLTPTKPRRVG